MEATKRRVGRPLKGEAPAGRISLGLKVTAETKAKLEALARDSGRSQSQEAEAAIERGQLLGDLASAGPAVANVLQEMLRAAGATVDTLGDPTASEAARDDLRQRWVQIAQSAFPKIAQAAPWQHAATAAVSAVRHAAIEGLSKLPGGEAGKTEAVRACARRLGQIATAEAYPGAPDWPAVEADLEAAAVETGGDFAEDVQAVLSLARAADRAVKRAESRK